MNKKIKNMLLLELGIIFLVLIIFIIVKLNIIKYMPECFINSKFDILCPSCGGTRCVTNLVLGNFKESFSYHPIFFITIIYLVIVNILYIINSFRKKEIATFLYPKNLFNYNRNIYYLKKHILKPIFDYGAKKELNNLKFLRHYKR